MGVFIVNSEHISLLFLVSWVAFEQANVNWENVKRTVLGNGSF